jgi:hypothetical protein
VLSPAQEAWVVLGVEGWSSVSLVMVFLRGTTPDRAAL